MKKDDNDNENHHSMSVNKAHANAADISQPNSVGIITILLLNMIDHVRVTL